MRIIDLNIRGFLGRVCVPFTAEEADSFSPDAVPTVSSLLQDIDDFSKDKNEDQLNIKDYKKTALKVPHQRRHQDAF